MTNHVDITSSHHNPPTKRQPYHEAANGSTGPRYRQYLACWFPILLHFSFPWTKLHPWLFPWSVISLSFHWTKLWWTNRVLGRNIVYNLRGGFFSAPREDFHPTKAKTPTGHFQHLINNKRASIAQQHIQFTVAVPLHNGIDVNADLSYSYWNKPTPLTLILSPSFSLPFPLLSQYLPHTQPTIYPHPTTTPKPSTAPPQSQTREPHFQ